MSFDRKVITVRFAAVDIRLYLMVSGSKPTSDSRGYPFCHISQSQKFVTVEYVRLWLLCIFHCKLYILSATQRLYLDCPVIVGNVNICPVSAYIPASFIYVLKWAQVRIGKGRSHKNKMKGEGITILFSSIFLIQQMKTT
jgi:hypothetical protein